MQLAIEGPLPFLCSRRGGGGSFLLARPLARTGDPKAQGLLPLLVLYSYMTLSAVHLQAPRAFVGVGFATGEAQCGQPQAMRANGIHWL